MSYSRANRSYSHTAVRRNRSDAAETSFICVHCGLYVPCMPELAGVQNRNHCPSCLWSRHLDSLSVGDRRSGCKAAMEPIGLTTKPSRNKYAREQDGELMLIHRCSRCRKIAINRIAADDSTDMMALCAASQHIDSSVQAQLVALGISLLDENSSDLVRRRLLGNLAH